jgi:hypothetical protein
MQLARRRGATTVEKAMRSILDRYMLKRDMNGIARVLLNEGLRDRLRKRTWSEQAMIVTDPSEFK